MEEKSWLNKWGGFLVVFLGGPVIYYFVIYPISKELVDRHTFLLGVFLLFFWIMVLSNLAPGEPNTEESGDPTELTFSVMIIATDGAKVLEAFNDFSELPEKGAELALVDVNQSERQFVFGKVTHVAQVSHETSDGYTHIVKVQVEPAEIKILENLGWEEHQQDT